MKNPCKPDNATGYGDARGMKSGNPFAKFNGHHGGKSKKIKGHHRKSHGAPTIADSHR